MATIPTTSTFTAGEKPTAAKMNANGKTALDFLLNPPAVSLRRSVTVQSIATGTGVTAISWDTEIFDTDNMWTSGTTITVNTAGLWLITGGVSFAPNATGDRLALIGTPAGGELLRGTQMKSSTVNNWTICTVSAMMRFTAGATFALLAQQDSGGALNTVNASTASSPYLQARWVGI